MVRLPTLATFLAINVVATCCLAQAPAKISFNRDIRPILSDKCFHCHGPDQHARETELRFDSKESSFADLGGYQAIVAGDPNASELVNRISSDDEDERMPPEHIGKPLKDSEIELLKRWIEEGATWEDFWAYTPPSKKEVPSVSNQDWSRHWIDRFVLSRLESKGLSASPPADKVTLVRRIYFDLIGLPPTPEEVAEFVNDQSPEAYPKLVDKLLASPHFGEKLAIYWLDLVRFADTVGYHGDQDHNISPYRDWVIDAFNQNMPFDQFTREQLAGDLISDATQSQRIASGYNRLLQTTHEGGLQPKEYRAIYSADRVRNVSMVWMGATVGCAQCHDHKYDPYTAKDFYSMAAFFADINDEKHFKNGTNDVPTRRSPEELIFKNESDEQSYLKTSAAYKKIESAKKAVDEKLATLEKAEKKKPPAATIAELSKEIERLDASLKFAAKAQAEAESRGAWTMVTETLDQPRETRVFPRGNWLDETGPIVQPAVPEFLGVVSDGKSRATRLDLANWLTDKNSDSGKLTARVMANRIWYLMMGVGVSRSLDDFGGQGQPPANPQLLDNLAIELLDSDWNIKEMFREIALTQAYKQLSFETEEIRKQDPYNEFFSHQSRYRLPGEVVRDNALAIAGLLNVDEVGGKSIKPYQPAGYYRHLNFPQREYKSHQDKRQWRRGVYVHWQRQFLHPTLKALDAPTREECTAQRSRSNTPQAALALLNDVTFVEAARHFSKRVRRFEKDDFEKQLNHAFSLAVSRKPGAKEVKILKQIYDDSLATFKVNPDQTKQLAGIGAAPHDSETFSAEDAAWTSVARVILNLDETITRN
jgi:hypothetical protein